MRIFSGTLLLIFIFLGTLSAQDFRKNDVGKEFEYGGKNFYYAFRQDAEQSDRLNFAVYTDGKEGGLVRVFRSSMNYSKNSAVYEIKAFLATHMGVRWQPQESDYLEAKFDLKKGEAVYEGKGETFSGEDLIQQEEKERLLTNFGGDTLSLTQAIEATLECYIMRYHGLFLLVTTDPFTLSGSFEVNGSTYTYKTRRSFSRRERVYADIRKVRKNGRTGQSVIEKVYNTEVEIIQDLSKPGKVQVRFFYSQPVGYAERISPDEYFEISYDLNALTAAYAYKGEKMTSEEILSKLPEEELPKEIVAERVGYATLADDALQLFVRQYFKLVTQKPKTPDNFKSEIYHNDTRFQYTVQSNLANSKLLSLTIRVPEMSEEDIITMSKVYSSSVQVEDSRETDGTVYLKFFYSPKGTNATLPKDYLEARFDFNNQKITYRTSGAKLSEEIKKYIDEKRILMREKIPTNDFFMIDVMSTLAEHWIINYHPIFYNK